MNIHCTRQNSSESDLNNFIPATNSIKVKEKQFKELLGFNYLVVKYGVLSLAIKSIMS